MLYGSLRDPIAVTVALALAALLVAVVDTETAVEDAALNFDDRPEAIEVATTRLDNVPVAVPINVVVGATAGGGVDSTITPVR